MKLFLIFCCTIVSLIFGVVVHNRRVGHGLSKSKKFLEEIYLIMYLITVFIVMIKVMYY